MGPLLSLLATAALLLPAAATRPATLVTLPGIVQGLAAGDGRLAWIETTWELRVRPLRGGRTATIRYTSQYRELLNLAGERRLVIAHGRLLWLSSYATGMWDCADRVWTAPLAAPRRSLLATYRYTQAIDGARATGIAGDATGLSFGSVTTRALDQEGSAFEVDSGGVWSVAGAAARRLPGAPPALVVGRGGGRLALTPADTTIQPNGQPVSDGTVEIRDAATGALVTTLTTGPAFAVVLAGDVAVVLTRGRIDRYSLADGGLLGTTPAPGVTPDLFAAAGDRVVFRTGRSLELLDPATGGLSTLATIPKPWQPGLVAADGRTVLWSEGRRLLPMGEPSRRNFRTRIRSLTLPR